MWLQAIPFGIGQLLIMYALSNQTSESKPDTPVIWLMFGILLVIGSTIAMYRSIVENQVKD